VERADAARGDVLVLPEQWRPTAVVDGRLRLVGPAPASRAVVHVHVGSARVRGRLRVVDGFARLRLERPIPLVPGDRMIVRDPGPSAIVGAVEVLDVAPPARLEPTRLARPVVEQRFVLVPWQRRADLAPVTGLDAHELEHELARLSDEGVVVAVGPWFVRADEHERAVAALVAVAAERARPVAEVGGAIGLSRDQAKALAEAVDEVTLDQNVVRHRDARATAATPAGRAVLDALLAAPFAPPDPRDVADAPGVLTALVREGAVTKCGEIWFATDALTEAAERVVTAFATTPELRMSDLRDLFGSSRKYTIEIAGWLDATGITRRQGDVRVRGAAAARTRLS
jgi:selenocysteine-specific elongation factor